MLDRLLPLLPYLQGEYHLKWRWGLLALIWYLSTTCQGISQNYEFGTIYIFDEENHYKSNKKKRHLLKGKIDIFDESMADTEFSCDFFLKYI